MTRTAPSCSSATEVLRRLSPSAADDWRQLRETAFFATRVSAGEIVATEAMDAADRPDVGDESTWPVVLRHERIPFVSYPYEWCFSQLQDAGALHIDLLLDALGEQMTMKDGYAYNLQFRGSAPVFIDVGSFEAYRGGPWAGYRQFCQTVLFPLLLQAHRNVPFRPFLRGQVNGIEPAQMRALMAGRDLMRAGVLKHVALHSAVDARHADKGDGSRATAEKLRDSGFSDAVALAAARNIGTLVRKLRWKPGESHWTTYQQTSTYTDAEREQKVAFVRVGARAAAVGTACSTSAATTGPSPGWPRSTPTTSSRSTATSRPSTRSTGSSAPRATARSSRW